MESEGGPAQIPQWGVHNPSAMSRQAHRNPDGNGREAAVPLHYQPTQVRNDEDRNVYYGPSRVRVCVLLVGGALVLAFLGGLLAAAMAGSAKQEVEAAVQMEEVVTISATSSINGISRADFEASPRAQVGFRQSIADSVDVDLEAVRSSNPAPAAWLVPWVILIETRRIF